MTKHAPILLLALLAAAIAGCQNDAPPRLLKGDTPLSVRDSAEYLDAMSSRPTVTEAEAIEGVLLVLGEEGKKRTFAQAVAFLTQRKILSPRWTHSADRATTKGRVAYMAYQTCNIRGGLTLTVLGPSQRYCLKELQYLGLMSRGQTYNTVTGMEYVAILTRADEYRQTGKVSDVMKKQEGSE